MAWIVGLATGDAIRGKLNLSTKNLGEAERRYLEALARGEEAQAGVLGPGSALLLQALQQVLTTLKEEPELVGMAGLLAPHTVAAGGGTGLEGMAAMLRPATAEAPAARGGPAVTRPPHDHGRGWAFASSMPRTSTSAMAWARQSLRRSAVAMRAERGARSRSTFSASAQACIRS